MVGRGKALAKAVLAAAGRIPPASCAAARRPCTYHSPAIRERADRPVANGDSIATRIVPMRRRGRPHAIECGARVLAMRSLRERVASAMAISKGLRIGRVRSRTLRFATLNKSFAARTIYSARRALHDTPPASKPRIGLQSFGQLTAKASSGARWGPRGLASWDGRTLIRASVQRRPPRDPKGPRQSPCRHRGPAWRRCSRCRRPPRARATQRPSSIPEFRRGRTH